jgi:hypothetical protein
MKTIFLLMLCNICSACPNIEGVWKSSASLSNDFNDSYAIITEDASNFYKQLYGYSTLTIKKSSMSLESSVSKITINGKIRDWNGNYTASHEILDCTDNAVSLKITMGEHQRLDIAQFVDEDTIWFYNGFVIDSGNGHTREYFVRQKVSER